MKAGAILSRKKLNKDGIYFTGMNANDVTGSQIYLRFCDKQILLECGLYQSSTNDYLDSYKENSKKFKFNPRNIDYVFVGHPHIDHIGLIPRLVKEGFSGKIIISKKSSIIAKELLANCAFILAEEAKILSKRHKRNYSPIYSIEDVYESFNYFIELDDASTNIKLDDVVSFRWYKNSHCIGAVQTQIILKGDNRVKKILYTSDIGALSAINHFVDNTEIPKEFSDVVIMESTYGSRPSNNKSRKFDIDTLKSAIDTALSRNGSVILPCFSFARTQEILTNIYNIYSKHNDFLTPVYIDSVLSCDICNKYSEILSGEDLKLWESVCKWKNINFIKSKDVSREIVHDSSKKIVISSSGFCTNGRVLNYLSEYLPDKNSMIIFSGYTGDNKSYLSYRIKYYKQHPVLTINNKKITNMSDCVTLSTFSSHASQGDLIKYGSNLNTNKLVLVHGSTESKAILSSLLEREISKNNKTYKVYSSTIGMSIRL